MKIIEALKLLKELTVKADDLRGKIANHSAHLSIETPVYVEQQKQVSEWLQAHEDITREMAKLHVQIAKTNCSTIVQIKVGDNVLSKSITEWIARRRTLAGFDLLAWSKLTDRGIKEGAVPSSTAGAPATPVRIVRCYDPVLRDKMVTIYRDEPGLIDRTLEVTNATCEILS